ncbi:hypothetical protein M9H77_09673 [Catharanthus roseus]|uniref:Uncharacterized protein n=1 Tax=Catharanthus roseus TaxID=4058 RepID=A0ACC0C1Q5_CATRO|nr:hypothetical protein M9H77_09673 [Catharanthus roseus]
MNNKKKQKSESYLLQQESSSFTVRFERLSEELLESRSYLETLKVSARVVEEIGRARRVRFPCTRWQAIIERPSRGGRDESLRLRQALSSLNQATRTVSRRTTGKTVGSKEEREKTKRQRGSVGGSGGINRERGIRAGWEKRTIYSQVTWVGSG